MRRLLAYSLAIALVCSLIPVIPVDSCCGEACQCDSQCDCVCVCSPGPVIAVPGGEYFPALGPASAFFSGASDSVSPTLASSVFHPPR